MLGPAVLVVVLSLVTQIVYPWRMTQLIDGDGSTIWLQALRIALLLSATIWAVIAIWPRRSSRNV